uniref:Uncharacterized protein n=1 Tax=Shewanella sp. (strain MR-7) TaxID=60481 RepID=Q0HPD9_SHESR
MNNIVTQVALLCPICGNELFHGNEDSEGFIACSDCGHECTNDELIADNSELIDEELKVSLGKAKKNLEDQMFKSLQRAFKGSKNIKIKRGR